MPYCFHTAVPTCPHENTAEPSRRRSWQSVVRSRNPDGEAQAWCYTTNGNIRWAYCDIPFCQHPAADLSPELYGPCINNTIDLRTAVTDYLDSNSSESSLAAEVYGWPIGDWCFDEDLRSVESTFEIAVAGHDDVFMDVGGWDVSRVEIFKKVFSNVQNISSDWGMEQWDTSNALNLQGVFSRASWNEDNPDLDLTGWDVSKVVHMGSMFQRSDVREVDLSGWDIHMVTSLAFMFQHANNLRRVNLTNWNPHNLVDMTRFVEGVETFNEDISSWNTGAVKQLTGAFMGATSFNQDLSQWDTRSLVNMNNAFREVPSYNHPMDLWDVSRVEKMRQTFSRAFAFNQDISEWDVSKVKDARWAFQHAISFNQNLCAWGGLLPSNVKLDGIFHNTSCPNQTTPDLSLGGPFCHNCD